MSDTTLVTATARIGAMRQRRSKVANTANSVPAVTKERSPTSPCVPIVAMASAPITARPATITSAERALHRQLFLEHQGREQKAAERGAGGLDHAAVGQRDEQKAGVAEQRERRPAEERQRHASGEAYAAQVAQPSAGDDRQKHEPSPHESVEQDIRRGEPDGDAVARRDKAYGPEQGGARAAEDADEIEPRRRRRAGGRLRRLHGKVPMRRGR